ncbi:MAG: ABC transporter ATP-binding protein [Egibacteraceae bacterium]
MTLLAVRDLRVEFPTAAGPLVVCDGVSFDVAAGEVVGVVGESGCGKTIMALSLLDLVPPPGRVTAGSIRLNGEELRGASPRRWRRVRGRRIGMVFQEPGRALDPVHTVAAHLREAGGRGVDVGGLLTAVGLEPAHARRYPHQLSGGQAQRAMIAVAIAGRPQVIVADEPTSSLDTVRQVGVLAELLRLRDELGCAIVLVSHQLGIISRVADRVLVMYLGQVMEHTDVTSFAHRPLHPYTRALLAAAPQGRSTLPRPIPGPPGQLTAVPAGCPFHPRCPEAEPVCALARPGLRRVAPGRGAACVHVPETR